MMYARRVMADTRSRSSTVPGPLFAALSIICWCARDGAGMIFAPDHSVSVFGLAGAEVVPPWHLCHSKANSL
jgi:hypothetical protein